MAAKEKRRASDPEISAIRRGMEMLKDLGVPARKRVIDYLQARVSDGLGLEEPPAGGES